MTTKAQELPASSPVASTAPARNVRPKHAPRALFEGPIVKRAIKEAFVKLNGAKVWSKNLIYSQGSEVCGWNRGYEGSYDDRHQVTGSAPHTGASILFAAGSALNQDPYDESFGIDNVFLWIR